MFSRRSRATFAIVLATAVALAVPSGAAAWRYKFQDFFDFAPPSATASSVIKAKKCHGGKLGNYNLVSRVVSGAGDSELFLEVRAKLPVTERFKQLKDIEVTVESTDDFDPSIIAEMTEAVGNFWEGVESRWKPGKLKFRHPELIIFGTQVLAAGKNTVDFKPKPGC